MTTDEVLDLFRESGALLEGHFILSSGLRSPIFLQKAKVFMSNRSSGTPSVPHPRCHPGEGRGPS